MRRRILLLVVGMTTLVVLAFAIPLTVLIRNNAYDNGVSALRNEADDLARFLREDNATKTSSQISAYLAKLDGDRSTSVELPDGHVLGSLPPGGLHQLPQPPQRFGSRPSTATAPSAETTSSAGADVSASPSPQGTGVPAPDYRSPEQPGGGFGRDATSQPYADGQLVQVLVPTFSGFGDRGADATLYTVRVYADDGTLHDGQTGPLLLLGAVVLALLLVGVTAGEVLTRRIIRPLVDTAGTAQRLSTGDTTARAPTDGPREVADVGLALNRLADRIDELIAEERETVADLSHRLRTPLTALRLDAEALSDPTEAERVGTHVSTLERMLTAVIRAARRPQREGRIPSCDAAAVVAERVRFWSALAEDQERRTQVGLAPSPLPVRAGEEDLAAAVDALLENVFAHTPEGTAFGVELVATPTGARLTITDEGPGLPPEAVVRGRSDRGSTGLGLDIARRCAEASGGLMTVGTGPAGGAAVTLEFGRS